MHHVVHLSWKLIAVSTPFRAIRKLLSEVSYYIHNPLDWNRSNLAQHRSQALVGHGLQAASPGLRARGRVDGPRVINYRHFIKAAEAKTMSNCIAYIFALVRGEIGKSTETRVSDDQYSTRTKLLTM
jgi:hypothetical protein